MAKIHTHYDNLKVARLAPQEVIRAAYKALSQKYHPDKNPGDDKAARIMAIINTAYGTLSDPVRRREHDEWIAAEEWEIEWLESTRQEDSRQVASWEPPHVEMAQPYKLSSDRRWWMGLALCFAIGCVAGALIMGQARPVPLALGALAHARADARAAAPTRDEHNDAWAMARPSEGPAQPPDIKALAVTQLVVPARVPDCEMELHSLIAPNGEPWPSQSGYVDGFPVGNQGKEVELLIDNSANGSPVLVKVYDMDRRSNVRHVYVLARDTITVDNLAPGKYEVRYQNIDVGGSQEECSARRKKATLAEQP